MDFQQLLKQASANQTYTQRRHELKKKSMEEERRKEAEEKRERVKKTSAALHDMKRASEKRQLEYRGIVNSRAAEFEKTVARSLPSSSSSSSSTSIHHKVNSDRLHPKPSSAARATSHTAPVTSSKLSASSHHQTAKGKQKSPVSSSKSTASSRPSTSKSAVASLQKSSPPSSRPHTTSSKSSAASGKSHTPSNATRQAKAPVNFQELMKLAEKKKTLVEDKDGTKGDAVSQKGACSSDMKKRGSGATKSQSEKSGRGMREGSPLGKQLLEKSYSRTKVKRMPDVYDRESGGGRGGCGLSTLQDRPGSSKGAHSASLDHSSVGGNSRESPQSHGGLNGRTKPGRGAGGRGERGRGRAGELGSGGRGRGGVRQGLPESALLMRERFRKELEASSRSKQANGGTGKGTKSSAKSQSFYGGAHAQLSKEERPRFQSKRSVAAPYQNSWVSEMSGYMQQLNRGEGGEDEGWSDEEEDDLSDFVVDEVEEGEDYSSAIREIFGYDKTRFNDDEFDDRVMESSFAQQQFEEQRSSRIGRQEDAEDIRKEANRLSRKRRKGAPASVGPIGLKQSKLSFR